MSKEQAEVERDYDKAIRETMGYISTLSGRVARHRRHAEAANRLGGKGPTLDYGNVSDINAVAAQLREILAKFDPTGENEGPRRMAKALENFKKTLTTGSEG